MKRPRFSFGKKGQFLNQNHSPNIPENQSYVLYRGIDDLPLSRFIDALIDGNLFALIKSGNPMNADKEDLKLFWRDNILPEYIKRIAPAEYQLQNSLEREILNLELKLTELNALAGNGGKYPIGALRLIYTKELEQRLCKVIHNKINLNPRDSDSYFRAIDKAFLMGNGMRLRLNFKRSELMTMIQAKSDEGNTEIGRGYFTVILVNLSDFAGYRLIAEELTVLEYLTRIEKLIAHNKQVEASLEKTTRR